MNLDLISPVAEDTKYKGGIEDFGNFAEGYCFKIKTESSDMTLWVICTTSMEDKKKLMATLKRIRLKAQRDNGEIVTSASFKTEPSPFNQLLNPSLALEKRKLEKQAKEVKPQDGYWVIIQDWSQCSLKCGGGQTVLQRMCVPPKSTGKPCVGEGILRKPCNNHPCPIVSKLTGASGAQNTTEILSPSVRIMQFSNRPQKYIKCIIKESDLLYSVDHTKISVGDNQKHNITTIPTRVVMTNKTLTVFAGEDYNTLQNTFDMMETSFHPSAKSEFCFVLTEKKKKAEFCLLGPERNKDMFNQWDYDFNLFKYQCYNKRPFAKLSKDDEKQINDKLNEAKGKMLIDQETNIIKRQKEKEIDDKEGEIVSSNKIALMAVQKQINLEAMIEKEEREREEQEEIRLQKAIEDEKNKHECAMKKIQEKEIENQYNIRAEEVDEEAEEIKKKAQQEVVDNRNRLKEKIRKMRKTSERKRAKLQDQLRSMRLKFSDEMVSAYKKGNQDHCLAVTLNRDNYKMYCLRMFPNNPEKYGRCTSSDNPCLTCCENEFNDMFYNDRVRCIKEICNTNNHVKGGTWVWETDVLG